MVYYEDGGVEDGGVEIDPPKGHLQVFTKKSTRACRCPFGRQKSWSTINPPKGHLQVFTKNITNKLWTVCQYKTRNIVRQKLRIKLWTICEYVTHNIAKFGIWLHRWNCVRVHLYAHHPQHMKWLKHFINI